ncbi:hypothetical protein J3Q64DRAFT_1710247 [Phycomyces blakesleeanus]|uniref:Uncharacterized protein n=2 Tax=Phycomyces blakesleeanus TaxID=4837 RepID=A0A162TBJ2_PHYB8|nr:hypothetical protein PHYBLDRAFT_77446 [Phycomyces blakesleeanus NRRL 1555(-)]OAD67362.1 hypothetical protein PHYBLDRAFT_77446 [Phycomyces blakesleeanus NRRL 1555(-)]|eukprot:XP_018285402.1 hypothetical protein PHYBLDRAFT_77446 [Phycomyces blakesleeanus NRRL 1555(-)]
MSFLWSSGHIILDSTKQICQLASSLADRETAALNSTQEVTKNILPSLSDDYEPELTYKDELAALMIFVSDDSPCNNINNFVDTVPQQQMISYSHLPALKPPPKSKNSRIRLTHHIKDVLEQIVMDSTVSHTSSHDILTSSHTNQIIYQAASQSQPCRQSNPSSNLPETHKPHSDPIHISNKHIVPKHREPSISTYRFFMTNLLGFNNISETVPTKPIVELIPGLRSGCSGRALSLAKLALEVERLGNHKSAIDMIISSVTSMMEALPVDKSPENTKRMMNRRIKTIEEQHRLDISSKPRKLQQPQQQNIGSLIGEIARVVSVMSGYPQASTSDPVAFTNRLVDNFSSLDSNQSIGTRVISTVYQGIAHALNYDSPYPTNQTFLSWFATHFNTLAEETIP